MVLVARPARNRKEVPCPEDAPIRGAHSRRSKRNQPRVDRPEDQRSVEYHSTLQPDAFENTYDNGAALNPQLNLIAGTSWLFARADWRQQPLDYLFVDEAGQLATANAVAVAGAGRNVVLLGDPQQLAQVSQAAHPDGAGDSVLEHLLGQRSTVRREDGMFLEHSYRMAPDVCDFISDLAYEGRLSPAPGTERRRVDSAGFSGTGLRFIAVEHEGNRQSSPEEARRIAEEIEQSGVVYPLPSDALGRTCISIRNRQTIGRVSTPVRIDYVAPSEPLPDEQEPFGP